MTSNNYNTTRASTSQIHNIEDLLSRFDNVKSSKPNFWMAKCPCHDDKKGSLGIALKDNKALIHCYAGCELEDILRLKQLTYSDLFFDKNNQVSHIYQYRNQDKTLNHEKIRYNPKRFTQRRLTDDSTIAEDTNGVAKVPYRLPQLIQSIKQGSLIIYTEGEKDADTAKILGYCATTFGSASDWKDEYKLFFKNANLVLIPDKDDAGLKQCSKIIDSIKPIAKSLKVIILPDGKDLTEWVESGNTNLQELIEKSSEHQLDKGVPQPKFKKTIAGYNFEWQSLNIKIVLDNIRDTDAEIVVYLNDKAIYISGFKMLSISHREELTRELLKRNKNIEWGEIINQVVVFAMADIRKGENIVWLDDTYGKERPEYLLEPLFVKNDANVIYADKSSAKSLLVTALDILISQGNYYKVIEICNRLELKTHSEHMVLFCDWENSDKTAGYTKECLLRGFQLDNFPIPYLHFSQPLPKVVNHLYNKIQEISADVIIIDSLGLAAGGDLNATEPALAFFAALRTLPVTPIILAHTSKSENNRYKTVYGNAYYQNEPRMIWETVKQQEPGASNLTVTLFHRKPAPFLPLHLPLAYEFTFDDDKQTIKMAKGKATIDTANLPNGDSENNKEPTTVELIVSKLQEKRYGTSEQIANWIERPKTSVSVELSRKKNIFGYDTNKGYYLLG